MSGAVAAVSAPGDGNFLYVVSKDEGQILRLDPATGNQSVFLDLPNDRRRRRRHRHGAHLGNERLHQDIGVNRLETLYSGSGGDTIFTTGVAQLAIDAGSGHDSVRGSVFGDTLAGNASNDVLVGRAGNDIIGGSGGSDRIEGDEGADLLFGEADPDSYIYRGLIDADDTIIGFETAAAATATRSKFSATASWRRAR
jgi:Ca2+-binding RTX toxin-like protein